MNRHEILRRQYWFLNVLTANTRWLTIPFRDNHVWVFACWGGGDVMMITAGIYMNIF